jgi:hypothetical protein
MEVLEDRARKFCSLLSKKFTSTLGSLAELKYIIILLEFVFLYVMFHQLDVLLYRHELCPSYCY